MGKVMVIDLAACNGCYNCQISCKDEHVGNDWSPIAKPQPDTGQFWGKLNGIVRGSVPKVKMTYQLSLCQQCGDAPCMEACSSKAIYRREDGTVIIDPDKCRGNKMCITACPYEAAIYFLTLPRSVLSARTSRTRGGLIPVAGTPVPPAVLSLAKKKI